MKKVLLTIAAIALFAVPASAQMLSLWADEGMTSCEVSVAGPYTPFQVYVFLEPGPDGAFAVEYKLTTPAGHFSPAGNVINPVVSGATIGVWYGAPGISAPFTSCQSDLFWVIMLNMMSPNVDPGYYMFEPNDDSNFMGVAICPDPRPLADATAYNYFGFNDGCVVGTEESSWGAIKNMME
jgi:hypothetical protein